MLFRSGTLPDIIACVAQSFRDELTPERLGARMNKLAALEHNPVLRPIPLVLKNPVLDVYKRQRQGDTCGSGGRDGPRD